jgi:hypothetical protein
MEPPYGRRSKVSKHCMYIVLLAFHRQQVMVFSGKTKEWSSHCWNTFLVGNTFTLLMLWPFNSAAQSRPGVTPWSHALESRPGVTPWQVVTKRWPQFEARTKIVIGEDEEYNLGGTSMGVWQGVAMDSLKFHPGPPCPTLLLPSFTPLDTPRRTPMGTSSP